MNRQWQRRIVAALLTAVVILSSAAVPASAADEGVNNSNFVLKGDYSRGDFTLTGEGVIFTKDGLCPGDVWISQIELKNLGRKRMDVSLCEIQNNTEDDSVVFDLLKLEIKKGEETLYSGPYGGLVQDQQKQNLFSLLPVAGGETVILDVQVEMPADVGNAIMGHSMDSTWIFEANYPESSHGGGSDDDDHKPAKPDEDGREPGSSNEAVDTGALHMASNTVPMLYTTVALSAAGTLLLLTRQKRRNKKEDKEE